MLNQSSRRAQTLRNFRWPPFETKQRNEKHFWCRFTSFTECEITADRDIARGAMIFPGSSSVWEIIALASAPNNKIVSAAFTICIIKRNSQRAEERKNSAPLKVKPSRAFLNSLHTDARFYVGAIQYYVSLHTPESMLRFLLLLLKTCFSFFLSCVPIFFTSLFLYHLLR